MATLVTKKFEELETTDNNGYLLPSSVSFIINSLCQEIGCSTETQNTYINQYNANVVNTSSYAKSNIKSAPKEYDGRANFNKQNARKGANEWKSKPGFSVTKFAMVDNSQSIIDLIRSDMNKISEQNIVAKIESMKSNIDEIVESTDEDEDDLKEKMHKLFSVIFNISVTNKLPVIYAKVYVAIAEKQRELLEEFMMNKLAEHMESLNGIVDVSENNYDEFCEFTAKNLARKNASALFCEIAKIGAIGPMTIERMDAIFEDLLAQVMTKINDKSKQKEADEITENLVVIITNLGKLLDKSKYLETMKTITGYKTGEKPGLSSRAKFKYMDLIGK